MDHESPRRIPALIPPPSKEFVDPPTHLVKYGKGSLVDIDLNKVVILNYLLKGTACRKRHISLCSAVNLEANLTEANLAEASRSCGGGSGGLFFFFFLKISRADFFL